MVDPDILAMQTGATTPFVTPNFDWPLGTSPNAGGWMGVAIYTQGVTLDVNGGVLCTFTTNALEFTLGLS